MVLVTRTAALTVQQVGYMPDEFVDGILYVSKEYELAIHLCACGCGEKTVTPLGDGGWHLTGDDTAPTLYPSIGNMHMPCGSHYFVKQGRIIWC